MIKEIAILLLLIAPACAWEFHNGTANLTESELLDVILTARAAGAGDTNAVFSKVLYNTHNIQYGDLWTYTRDSNQVIRAYNVLLEDHFNSSVVAEWKLTEYAI